MREYLHHKGGSSTSWVARNDSHPYDLVSTVLSAYWGRYQHRQGLLTHDRCHTDGPFCKIRERYIHKSQSIICSQSLHTWPCVAKDYIIFTINIMRHI